MHFVAVEDVVNVPTNIDHCHDFWSKRKMVLRLRKMRS